MQKKYTALMQAAAVGCTTIVKLLLSHVDVDINKQNEVNRQYLISNIIVVFCSPNFDNYQYINKIFTFKSFQMVGWAGRSTLDS